MAERFCQNPAPNLPASATRLRRAKCQDSPDPLGAQFVIQYITNSPPGPFTKVRTRDKRLNGYFSFLASHSSARQPLAQRGGRVRADD